MTPAFDIRIQHAAELRILGRLHPRQSLASFARWALVHPHVFGFGRLHDVRAAAREVLAQWGEVVQEPAPPGRPSGWRDVRDDAPEVV